ncbi:hypothetical protein Y032_0027g1566 [Ancylostoma ceylanicum]|nr:hypothetical protein Y032_0027g1566 [Ancylostoma ceylanicum]
MNSLHYSFVIHVAIFARSLARYTTSFVHFLPEYDPFSPFPGWMYPQNDQNAYYAVISREPPSAPGKTAPTWFMRAPVATYHSSGYPYTLIPHNQYYPLDSEVPNTPSTFFTEQPREPRTFGTVSQHDDAEYPSYERPASQHDGTRYASFGRTDSQRDDAGHASFGRTYPQHDDVRYPSFGRTIPLYDDSRYAPQEPNDDEEDIPESTLYYPEMLRARLYKQLQAVRRAYRLRKALGKMKSQ